MEQTSMPKNPKKSKLTAIHYAVHNNNIDALKLIAQAGADLTALDKDGNQPIVSAALFGQTEMVEYLVNYNKTLKEDVVKVYELLAVFEIENENFDSGLAYLRKALGVKEQYFLCQKEPNMEELQNLLHYFFVPKIKTDVDILPRDKGSLHAVSVLIKSRYFSILNNEILFSLLEYATCIKNEEAFRVFSFVHNKFLEKRKCLHENAIYAVSSAIRSIEKTIKDEVPLDRKYIITNLRELFHHLVHQISECIKDDRFKKKKEKIINFQLLIGHSLCIINLMLKHDYKTFPNISKLFADDVRRLINVNPRFSRGDTMLHVMMSNTDVFEEENRVNQSFPKMDKLIIEYLLLQGLDPDCRNAQGETALHLLMSQNDTMEDDEVVKDILILLLEQGAHIDVRDDNDRTPLAMIRQKGIQIPEVNFRSLKCYAANVIADMGIQYKTILPLTLLPFVELHKSVDM